MDRQVGKQIDQLLSDKAIVRQWNNGTTLVSWHDDPTREYRIFESGGAVMVDFMIMGKPVGETTEILKFVDGFVLHGTSECVVTRGGVHVRTRTTDAQVLEVLTSLHELLPKNLVEKPRPKVIPKPMTAAQAIAQQHDLGVLTRTEVREQMGFVPVSDSALTKHLKDVLVGVTVLQGEVGQSYVQWEQEDRIYYVLPDSIRTVFGTKYPVEFLKEQVVDRPSMHVSVHDGLNCDLVMATTEDTLVEDLLACRNLVTALPEYQKQNTPQRHVLHSDSILAGFGADCILLFGCAGWSIWQHSVWAVIIGVIVFWLVAIILSVVERRLDTES